MLTSTCIVVSYLNIRNALYFIVEQQQSTGNKDKQHIHFNCLPIQDTCTCMCCGLNLSLA